MGHSTDSVLGRADQPVTQFANTWTEASPAVSEEIRIVSQETVTEQ